MIDIGPVKSDPALLNKRAKKPPTLKEQWITAVADMTIAKSRLVDTLLTLQGLQLDYMNWWDTQPEMFRKSKRGRKLREILDLHLTLDVRHLTSIGRMELP